MAPPPFSSPFSLATAALGAANLGVLKTDASLASNGFFEWLVLDTSLKIEEPSFFSACFSPPPNEPNTGALSNGFLKLGATLEAALVSGALDLGKPKVKEGTDAVVGAPVSPLDAAVAGVSLVLLAGWLLDLTPNVKVVGVLAAVDMVGVPKLIEPAGLSDVPNLNEFV